MFFDWDELEKTWSAMSEPWDLHDFAFMGRFSWSDECENAGIVQHVYQHETSSEHHKSISRSKSMREVTKHLGGREKESSMQSAHAPPIRDEALLQRLHESIRRMQLTRHSQHHAIRSIMSGLENESTLQILDDYALPSCPVGAKTNVADRVSRLCPQKPVTRLRSHPTSMWQEKSKAGRLENPFSL